ncbi:MAG: gliding motility-associated C-terminal domain-containing protein, partial [Bacteroidota bacterium]
YTFTVLVSGSNTGAFWSADDPNATVGGYGNNITFGPYLISDGDLTIMVTDSDDPSCTSTFTVTAPPTCSVPPPCSIEANAGTPVCDDNGTPNDASDDTYTFTVLVSGSNTGAFWSADDPNTTVGGYESSTTFGPYLISDGDLTVTVTDSEDASCTSTFTVAAPPTCSVPPPCSIAANAGTPICDDNGTPNDASDDSFTFTVLVSGSNTGAFWSADDPNATIGGYGNNTTFGPYLISNGDLTITVTDSEDASCTSTFSVSAPPTCSVPPPCSIEANAGTPICDDNGTPNDASDDTYTFTVLVSGSNTGASWSADDPNATVGGYGISTTFGPYLISDGDLTITVTDSEDGGCTNTFTVTAPPTCSVCNVFVDAGPDRLISCDQPEAELIGIAVGAESASWTNAAGDTVGSSNEVNIDEAGSYIFSAVFPNGCTDSDTMVVISDQEAPLAIIFADPDSLLNCVATSLELTSPGESGVIYNWETDDGMVQTDALQVTQEGTYSLIALDTLNGCSSSASISIPDFTDFPFIDLEPEVVLDCEDGRITLDASGSQSGPSIQYQWLDEDGIPIPNADQNELTVSEPGIYFLTLTDVNNGCENTDTVQVEPSSTVSVMLPAEVQINQNDPFLLEGSTNLNEDEIARIFWTPGELVTCDTCLSTRVLNIEDQRFTLFVESIDGCLGSASTFVRRLPRAAVYVPNGFSPNDDGVNDRLRPFANEQVERIDLFLMADRWGNTVFRIEDVLPDDPALEWNGRFREQLVPVAVYVYYLRVRLDTGETLELKGDVTLVR